MADKSQRKASKDGNAAAMIAALCIKCLLAIIGDLLDYLNGLAIVRVAVYGEPFCVAARRTMNMMKYRGMDQIINDDLSGMPVWLGCWICALACAPFMYGCYKIFPWLIVFKIEGAGVGDGGVWFLAGLASFFALFIPFTVLGPISS